VNLLLTGANGFVGSHILDELLRLGHRVTVLLRQSSDTRHIRDQLPQVTVRRGSLEDADSLRQALQGVEVVVHCAGKTKAIHGREYYAVNVGGTACVVEACNGFSGSLRQLVLISSLAASGPGTVQAPAREDGSPRPVSHYGRSKWLGEKLVRRRSRVPYTILRPAAVYGPRDRDFYLVFKMVGSGIVPLINGGMQPLSFVYAGDVAEAVGRAVGRDSALGRTYHVAHPVPCTQRDFALSIAGVMGVEPARFYVPSFALYPVCLVDQAVSAITGTPSILNLDKIAEYTAPGWVCSTDLAAAELDFVAGTSLEEGLRRTLDWYGSQGWLPSP
jgi:nucleoside-diphosphate-sugar epimerase